jgi:Putative peptidoglycan binding domain
MPADLNFEAEPFGAFSRPHGGNAEEFETVVVSRGYGGGPAVRDHRGGYGAVVRDNRGFHGATVRAPLYYPGSVHQGGPGGGAGRWGGWANWQGRGRGPAAGHWGSVWGTGHWPGAGHWGGSGLWGDRTRWGGPGRWSGFGRWGAPREGYWPASGAYPYPDPAGGPLGASGGFGFAPPMGDPQTVAWAQGCLAQVIGPWVPQDGALGPATLRAIRTFQVQAQLPASGALDDGTLALLAQACQPAAAAGGAGAPSPQDSAPPTQPGDPAQGAQGTPSPGPQSAAPSPAQPEAFGVAGYDPSQHENFGGFNWQGYGPQHRRHHRRRPCMQPDFAQDMGAGDEAEVLHENGPTGSTRDQAVIAAQVARGIRDENKVVDAVFYARHPGWTGKSLKTASRALRQEWLQIRDTIVRPQLQRSPVPPWPAPPPPAPVPPAKPAPLPSAQPGAGIWGYNSFDNIRMYRPAQYPAALAAQGAFKKVIGFLPWYLKIKKAVPTVSIALDSHGIGNLVFSMDKHPFFELVDDKELTNKVVETVGSGMLGRLEFTVDFIGLIGLGATLLDIARGIQNERMLGGIGPQYDQWRRDKALEFVIGLLAEDLSRHNLSGSYFVSRNARDLVVEIANDLAQFQPINYAFVGFLLLEDDLARRVRDWGNVPDVLPTEGPHMGVPPPGL